MSNASVESVVEQIKKQGEQLAGVSAAAAPARTLMKKSFSRKAWDTYVVEQVTKSQTDTAEVSKLRLASLAKSQGEAAAAFETKKSITLEVFVEGDADDAEDASEEGVFSQVGKHLVSLGKALKDDPKFAAKVKKKLSANIQKRADAKGVRAKLTKATVDPLVMLEKIYTMFGIDPSTDNAKNLRASWEIESAVHALESAAKQQRMMAKLANSLGVNKAKDDDDDEPTVTTKKSKPWATDISKARADARQGS